jgi:GrpB-like predicted nucleotidyltransferase (UPF0157 family)
MESFETRLERVLGERIELVDYDSRWPGVFESEVARLRPLFEPCPIRRVEHVGSTAVPRLAAKPIVDILLGVDDLGCVDQRVAPEMESAGYDYFWRPLIGDTGPSYPWFIGRDGSGRRISHVHVALVGDSTQWDRVVFRDYLRSHPQTAHEYAGLKRELASRFAADRPAYTQAKSAFILAALASAARESRA